MKKLWLVVSLLGALDARAARLPTVDLEGGHAELDAGPWPVRDVDQELAVMASHFGSTVTEATQALVYVRTRIHNMLVPQLGSSGGVSATPSPMLEALADWLDDMPQVFFALHDIVVDGRVEFAPLPRLPELPALAGLLRAMYVDARPTLLDKPSPWPHDSDRPDLPGIPAATSGGQSELARSKVSAVKAQLNGPVKRFAERDTRRGRGAGGSQRNRSAKAAGAKNVDRTSMNVVPGRRGHGAKSGSVTSQR